MQTICEYRYTIESAVWNEKSPEGIGEDNGTQQTMSYLKQTEKESIFMPDISGQMQVNSVSEPA